MAHERWAGPGRQPRPARGDTRDLPKTQAHGEQSTTPRRPARPGSARNRARTSRRWTRRRRALPRVLRTTVRFCAALIGATILVLIVLVLAHL